MDLDGVAHVRIEVAIGALLQAERPVDVERAGHGLSLGVNRCAVKNCPWGRDGWSGRSWRRSSLRAWPRRRRTGRATALRERCWPSTIPNEIAPACRG